MKASSRCSLLLVVAVMATTGVAATAHAQTFNPDFTSVDGQLSGSLTMTYGFTIIECSEVEFSGITATDSSILDVDLDFGPFINCDINGFSATTTCDNPVTLIALDATSNEATLQLPSGFDCDIEIEDVCTISIEGPQSPLGFAGVQLDESADTMDWNVDVNATRTGSTFCGASASGIANIRALFDVSPSNFSIDP
jgi:hypothetical protein